MTDNEKELNRYLDEIFQYCKQHKDTCEGCIFYRQLTLLNVRVAYCRVMYAPDVFKSASGE